MLTLLTAAISVLWNAMEAIKKLEAMEEEKWHSEDDIDQFDDASEEYQPHSSDNSIKDDDDTQSSSEAS